VFGSYVLDSQPSADFRFDQAKNKLVGLELGADDAPNIVFVIPGEDMAGEAIRGEHGGTGRQGRLMRLAGWMDLDSSLTVCLKCPTPSICSETYSED
jgi:DNA mismatch repair protein MSH5